MMEFVPLRSLQRGLPEVWETLHQENGRIVLTNKGQPTYLLIDLEGQNVVSLINWIDYYRANIKSTPNGQALTPEQKTIARNFLAAMQAIRDDGLSAEDEKALAALDRGKYKTSFSRELDL